MNPYLKRYCADIATLHHVPSSSLPTLRQLLLVGDYTALPGVRCRLWFSIRTAALFIAHNRRRTWSCLMEFSFKPKCSIAKSPAASKSVCRLSTLLIRIHISGSCEDSPYDTLNGRGRGVNTRQQSMVSLVAPFRATLQGLIPQWVMVVDACTSSLVVIKEGVIRI